MRRAKISFALWGAAVAAIVAVWLACLPHHPFFGDVPLQLHAMDSGEMVIQFPGYAPWHLLILGFRAITGSLETGMVTGTLVLAFLSVVQVGLTAQLFLGRWALLVASVFGLQIFTVYFATSGSSYPADMAAVSGMIYFGMLQLRVSRPSAFYGAVAWFCAGLLLRPLSCMLALPGLLFLAWKHPRRIQTFLILAAAIAGTAFAYLALSVPFYEGIRDFFTAQNVPAVMAGQSVSHPDARSYLSNGFRMAVFSLYGFHVWWPLTALVVWQRRRSFHFDSIAFLFWLSLLYGGVLAVHLPQAGYLCYLAPVILLLPVVACLEPRKSLPWVAGAGVLSIGISLFQLVAVRPIPTVGKPSAVINAYAFQYSRAGIRAGQFDTLASLLYRSGLSLEEIPPERIEAIKQQLLREEESRARREAAGEAPALQL